MIRSFSINLLLIILPVPTDIQTRNNTICDLYHTTNGAIMPFLDLALMVLTALELSQSFRCVVRSDFAEVRN